MGYLRLSCQISQGPYILDTDSDTDQNKIVYSDSIMPQSRTSSYRTNQKYNSVIAVKISCRTAIKKFAQTRFIWYEANSPGNSDTKFYMISIKPIFVLLNKYALKIRIVKAYQIFCLAVINNNFVNLFVKLISFQKTKTLQNRQKKCKNGGS